MEHTKHNLRKIIAILKKFKPTLKTLSYKSKSTKKYFELLCATHRLSCFFMNCS